MTRRTPVQKSERFGATPETAAKLRPDPLQTLMRTANMGPAEERAAAEIRAVYIAVCRDVMGKVMSWTPPGVDGRGRGEMSNGLAEAHAARFRPWTLAWRKYTTPILRLIIEREEPGMAFRPMVAMALRDYARRMTH
tara:strand:- start:342 stop:752 length:411 start_codon:yes stop_codon:yes gene_type:complete